MVKRHCYSIIDAHDIICTMEKYHVPTCPYVTTSRIFHSTQIIWMVEIWFPMTDRGDLNITLLFNHYYITFCLCYLRQCNYCIHIYSEYTYNSHRVWQRYMHKGINPGYSVENGLILTSTYHRFLCVHLWDIHSSQMVQYQWLPFLLGITLFPGKVHINNYPCYYAAKLYLQHQSFLVRCTPIMMTLSTELRVTVPTVWSIHYFLASQQVLFLQTISIHCDGTQLNLADTNLGSEWPFNSSSYYQWSDGQLLFIFPPVVSLTTITLHYYSDRVWASDDINASKNDSTSKENSKLKEKREEM